MAGEADSLLKNKQFKSFIETKKFIIADPTSSARKSVRRLATEIGIKSTNLEVLDSFPDAAEKLTQTKAEIVFSELDLGNGKTGFDLLEVHQKLYPNRLHRSFFITSGKNSPSIAASVADGEVDTLILKPFTFNELKDKIAAVFQVKLAPSQYLIQVENGKSLLNAGKFPEAITVLTAAQKLDPAPSTALYYIAATKDKMGDTAGCEASFEEGLKLNPTHYKCLNGLFDIKMKQKKHEEAYQLAVVLVKNYPVNPARVPDFVWLSVYLKKYGDIVGLHEGLSSVADPVDASVSKYLSAGLAVCGKFFLNDGNTDKGLSAFKSAEKLSEGKVGILKMIASSLFEGGQIDEGNKFLSRAPPEVKDAPEVQVAEIKFAYAQGDLNRVMTLGTNLVALGFKDFSLFEMIILASIKSKRRGAVIEEIVGAAINAFPDKKEYFETLLKEANLS